jgi:hypothetical protein
MSHLTEVRSRPNIKIQRSGSEMLDEFRGLLPATDLSVRPLYITTASNSDK